MMTDLFKGDELNPKHDPGGKVRLPVAQGIKSTAVFGGPSDCYRYRLVRTWHDEKPHVMFLMMNPSTADPLVDDPTIRLDRITCSYVPKGGAA